MRHRGDRALVGVELVQHRLAQVRPDQAVDVTVERGREQHPLAGGRRGLEQLVDGRVEAQVAQVVGLVEDGDLHVVGAAVTLVHQVLQAARRGDDDVGPGAQLLDLAVVRRAAVHGDELELRGERQRLDGAAHLGGQLAGRDDDQRARVLGAAVLTGQAGQDRQAEGERLAGAGLGAAEHVRALHGVRDDGGLDRRRGGDLELLESHDHLAGQAELGEGRQGRSRGRQQRIPQDGGHVPATNPRRGPASLRDAVRARSLVLRDGPRTHTGPQKKADERPWLPRSYQRPRTGPTRARETCTTPPPTRRVWRPASRRPGASGGAGGPGRRHSRRVGGVRAATHAGWAVRRGRRAAAPAGPRRRR